MVNNFHAAKAKTAEIQKHLQELEVEVNAIPVKTQGAKQAFYQILKRIENIEDVKFWIERAEKSELEILQ
jgi:hypothetical protein